MGKVPVAVSKFAEMVARSSAELMNVLGTGVRFGKGPIPTVLVEKKLVPAMYTSCCTDPCAAIAGSPAVIAGSTAEPTVTTAVADCDESNAEVALMSTAPEVLGAT